MINKNLLALLALCTIATVKAECETATKSPDVLAKKHYENEIIAAKLDMRRDEAAKYWAAHIAKLMATK